MTILIGLLIVLISVFASWVTIRRKIKQHVLERAKTLVALKILVPKGVATEEGERGPQDFREAISVAEQFLANFSSLYSNSLQRKIYGQETISLEIIAKNDLIGFYIVVPTNLQNLVERQLHSFYPDAQIEPSTNYKMFEQDSFIAASHIKAAKSFAYPIKTYKNLESEPLNGITNAFSKIPEGTTAGLQILLRPTSDRWREKTRSTAKAISEGKSSKGHWSLRLLNLFFEAVRGGSKEEKPAEPVRLTPIQEEKMKGVQEKGSKVGYETQIKILVASINSLADAQVIVDGIAAAFGQYNSPELNHLKKVMVKNLPKTITTYILRQFENKPKTILNTEEIASIYHPPNIYIDTPNIEWLTSRTLPPPTNLPEAQEGTVILGKSVFRGQEKEIRIKLEDRRRHLYAIGKTGVGKTTVFINAIVQDILAGRGVCYMDPNGDAIEELLSYIPKERAEDVILFDPSDIDRPLGLNMLEWERQEDRDFLVSEWLEIFYKLFDPGKTGIIGPQFEHWGRNASLSVMSLPEGGTLIDIPRLFTDDAFREKVISYVKDPVVLAFWNQQLAKTADFHKSEMFNYFISKFGRFMTNDLMRNIIGQTKSSFNFREIMDEGKIFLVNLSKGKIGETNSHLLGMVLAAKIQVAAFQRADTPETERKDFYLYIDEFQNFTTDTFKTVLAEARKYRLNLNITNQYIAQLPEDIRDAIIGNAGTLITFRIGAADAEFMVKEFPDTTVNDMVNLNFATTYIKLLIDGTPTKPFSMRTIKTTVPSNKEMAEAIKNLSRLKYGRDKRIVEEDFNKRQIVEQTDKFIPDFPPARES